MANLETRPGKITIPGRPEAVDLSRIRGNIGRIKHEFGGDEVCIDRLPQGKNIKDALARGERAFLTRGEGVMFVTRIFESLPIGETVLIPSRPVEIDLSQVSGDIRSGIRFEVSLEDQWITDLEKGPEIQNTLENGGRVFITEDDDLLLVNPPF